MGLESEHEKILEQVQSLVNLYKITIRNFVDILEKCFTKNKHLFKNFKLNENGTL